MNILPTGNAKIVANTQSGSMYTFREYETGKWEVKRDGPGLEDRFGERWIKLMYLPRIVEGESMMIFIQGQEHIETTPVTFVGRNN